MSTLKKIYSDIDLTFSKQPGKGDIVLSYDDQAVIRSIRSLLLTNYYERPFQPDLGCNITSIIFEPISSMTASILQKEIENAIKNYEPRATILDLDITASPDTESFFINLQVFIGNNTSPSTINLLLQRNR